MLDQPCRIKLKEILKQKKEERNKGYNVESELFHSEHIQSERTTEYRKQGEYGAKKNIKP